MIPAWASVLAALLALLALPVAAAALYLLVLSLLSWPRPAPAVPRPETLRFDFVVPAHDEAAGIAATVKSLLAVDYPAGLRQVVVVADNCTDDTAARARAAGATVLERTDAEKRGKGYALEYAFTNRLALDAARAERVDALVVVDADTIISPNLLHAFSARLASGEVAIQAHYGVQNPEASWRTRLMRIALATFHQVRSHARERLGVSCGLRGNGMCFSAALLREVPHDAHSIVEDLEFGVRLGRLGHRVAYAGEAEVLGEMVSGEKASRSQRHRWEHGRAQLARTLGFPVLREAVAKRSLLLFDLAMDLLVPPLSRVVLGALTGLVVSCALLFATGAGAVPAALYGGALVALGLYVMAGWLHSGTGAAGLLDLALAPAYVAWKVGLALGRPAGEKKKEEDWVRTTREGETRP